MMSEPLKTDALVQLLTAANMPASTRDRARENHRDDDSVTLDRQDDFTYRLVFANGEFVRLSYAEGAALAPLIER